MYTQANNSKGIISAERIIQGNDRVSLFVSLLQPRDLLQTLQVHKLPGMKLGGFPDAFLAVDNHISLKGSPI